jgi:UDP-N-acetyl-D-mannosaminuronic acid transferase (WecB/TagA/CpsF family)
VFDNERFICRHWHRLQHAGIKIAVANHDAIDIIIEASSKVPQFTQSIHLQRFIHSLCHPTQFFSRYIKGTLRFILLLIRQKGKQTQP